MTTIAATGVWQDDDLPTDDDLGADPGPGVDGGAPVFDPAVRDLPSEQHPTDHDPAKRAAFLTTYVRGVRRAAREITDRVEREALAGDLRRLADFYLSHPEIPVPASITAASYVDWPTDLEPIAESLGARIYGSDASPQISQSVTPASGPGAWVSVLVGVAKRDRPL
jgi:hypothetical protein